MRRRSSHPLFRRKTVDLIASSEEGSLAFTLTRRSTGLYVERLQHRADKGRATHAMHFSDEAAFVHWCLADGLQFRYPLLYSKLKRAGCSLLSSPPRDHAIA
jgi:hypothetical protein